jgi:hypothetical protein
VEVIIYFSGVAFFNSCDITLAGRFWKKNYSIKKADREFLFLSVSVITILWLGIFGFSLTIDSWNIIVLVLTFIYFGFINILMKISRPILCEAT